MNSIILITSAFFSQKSIDNYLKWGWWAFIIGAIAIIVIVAYGYLANPKLREFLIRIKAI